MNRPVTFTRIRAEGFPLSRLIIDLAVIGAVVALVLTLQRHLIGV